MSNYGSIILLNGASSAGKSTLAQGLQSMLPDAFWHYSIDHLSDAKVLPRERIRSGEFRWNDLRDSFFEGFHRSIPAFAQAGNNLIVEHIIEEPEWMERLLQLLDGFDVFFIGVHCPLEELERREVARGDRPVGDAKRDFEIAHRFCRYDLEIDSMEAIEKNIQMAISTWQDRGRVQAFDLMRKDESWRNG